MNLHCIFQWIISFYQLGRTLLMVHYDALCKLLLQKLGRQLKHQSYSETASASTSKAFALTSKESHCWEPCSVF